VFSDVDFSLSMRPALHRQNTNSQTARTGPRLWPEHARYIHTPQSMMYKETQAQAGEQGRTLKKRKIDYYCSRQRTQSAY